MKANLSTILILSAIAMLGMSCEDVVRETKSMNVPEYMSAEDVRASVGIRPIPQEGIAEFGKIYVKGDYIFINEPFKGIHLIDNKNPKTPSQLKFISIPGNIDMAVKGNILYADSYRDLVVLDIENIHDIKVVDRVLNLLPYTAPLPENNYPTREYDTAMGIVVGWKVEKVTEEKEYYGGNFIQELSMEPQMRYDAEAISTDGSGNYSLIGTGGSMARFTISNDMLYIVDNSNLQVLDISVSDHPEYIKEVSIGMGIETIFPNEDRLFIGSAWGMFIYDISNPEDPAYVSEFAHVVSCDPVVVEGNTAYVTLREGNNCGGFVNQLDVIDITDINEPKLEISYEMFNPHGLAVVDSVLYLCDGDEGLKIYDVGDKMSITEHQLAHFDEIHAYDVIPIGDKAIMIGDDGLYQYDITNIEDVKLISLFKKAAL